MKRWPFYTRQFNLPVWNSLKHKIKGTVDKKKQNQILAADSFSLLLMLLTSILCV